jgi:predicted DCC family thiol-disulfide oxidoreductase YuxK
VLTPEVRRSKVSRRSLPTRRPTIAWLRFARGVAYIMYSSAESANEPFGYKSDPSVPVFPDDRPIILFDGHCVLCSRLARFILRHDDRNGRARFKSDGTIRMFAHLGFPWSAVALARVIPRPIRDRLYDLIAKNRKWFGSQSVCFLPEPAHRDRFLG